MLVIADRDRAPGGRRRHGRRRVRSVVGDDDGRVRERVLQAGVGAADEQAARPEDRSLVALRARRRHQRTGRRARARDRADGADRRRPRRRRRSSTAIPRSARAARLHLRRDRLALLLGAAVADADVERILRGARPGGQPRPPTAGTSSRRPSASICCAKSTSSRKSAVTTASTSSSRRFPCQTRAGAAARSAHSARSAGAPRAHRGRAVRSRHVRVHRGEGGRSVLRPGPNAAGSVRSPTRCRPSSTRCGRRCCPASSTPSRTTGATAGAMSACSRSARASRRGGETRGVGARVDRQPGAPSTGRAAHREVDFFDVKGVVERLCDALGMVPHVRGRSTLPFLVPGQAASVLVRRRADRRRSARSHRRSPKRAALPRQDEVFVAELDLDRCAVVARRPGRRGRVRCRAIRSSSAICRSSSPTPCLPRSFVAPFRRPAHPRRRRWRASRFSIATRARAFREGTREPVGAPDVPGRRPHADRRRGPAERRQRFWPRSSREHGAVQR